MNKAKNIIAIVIFLLLIGFCILYVKKAYFDEFVDYESKISTKEDVEAYLLKKYPDEKFEIDNNVGTINEKSGVSCNGVRIKSPLWKVTKKSTGEVFEVYEILDSVRTLEDNNKGCQSVIKDTLTKDISY